MTDCRRKQLPELEGGKVTNAGLVYAKWLAKQEAGLKTAVPHLLEAICSSPVSKEYKSAFQRWSGLSLGSTRPGTCLSPLAIGLGNESPLEVGLTFHHTYGTPVIPGSAIKGLLRRAMKESGEASVREVFGDNAAAGGFVFHDAWFDPSSVDGKPFHRDVVTVHHPAYYSSRGAKAAPTDFDDPTPVPFLVVRPEARFLFRIEPLSPEWETLVWQALEWALTNLGVGAKTNAGYGRIRLEISHTPTQQRDSKEEIWENVALHFNPGNREVSVQCEGKKASAKIDDIVCPPSVSGLLQGKARSAKGTIRVIPVGGKNYRIHTVLEEQN